QEEDGRAEPEDALDACDRDDGHCPECDGELDHPGQADEPCREQDRIPPRGRHESSCSRPRRKAAPPPCAGCRTYVPPNASYATRPTATTRRRAASSRANGTPAATSPRVGRRFACASPGCVGTAFQRSTSCSRPSSANTL